MVDSTRRCTSTSDTVCSLFVRVFSVIIVKLSIIMICIYTANLLVEYSERVVCPARINIYDRQLLSLFVSLLKYVSCM